MTIISFSLLFLALVSLVVLTFYDFKKMILPNLWVLAFAVLGLLFHFSQDWQPIPPLSSFIGFLVGGGFLLLIRFFANAYYKKNTLGMGDVKLMMAGGLWIGFPNILVALSIGAFAGALIGYIYIMYQNIIKKQKLSVTGVRLPAGPGFIVGIVATFIWFYFF